MHATKMTFVAAVAFAGASLAPTVASAHPVAGLNVVKGELSTAAQTVRWVCGPYRCWWRPSYYAPAYGYYAPRHYRRSGFYGPGFSVRW